jgi:hypothetical protein
MKVFTKNLSHKFSWLFITAIFFNQFVFGAKDQFVTIKDVSKTDTTLPKFEFELKRPYLNCQSLTYLKQPKLKEALENNYSQEIYFNKIQSPDATPLFSKNDFFENLINSTIKNEIKFKNDYYVFYHVQHLEFLLFQDLFKDFYKLFSKKTLKDFFMLRTPNQDNAKFKTISNFLKFYSNNNKIKQKYFDYHAKISNLLLSVNPSLFGNEFCGESNLTYFFTQDSIYREIMPFIKSIFSFYKIDYLFEKYKKEIKKLRNLLFESQKYKTELLLQIFIPKNKIGKLVYRAYKYGKPYYKNQSKSNLASADLNIYQNNSFYFAANDLDKIISLDKMQFKLLINDKVLNPDSGIKMFRYYDETENVKKYKEQFNKLIDQINKDIVKKNF